MAKYSNSRIIILFTIVACLVSGCDFFAGSSERLARARVYQSEANHQAAIIELKKVLESEPDNVQSRLLLGDSYSWFGRWADAEKEYRRAADLGAAAEQYLVALGKVLLAQNRFQPLLDELPDDEVASAEQLSVRGEALIALNQSSQAKVLYERLLLDERAKLLGLIGLAKVALVEGDVIETDKNIAQALELAPESIDALLIKGQVEFVSARFDQAEQVFSKVLELKGNALPRTIRFTVLAGLVESQLQQAKRAEAKKNISVLAQQFAAHPRTKYFIAMMAYDDAEYARARDNLTAVLNVAPDFLPAQILMGAVHYQLNNFEQADSILTAVLSSNPNNKEIRKLLVATRIKYGRAEEAVAILDPSLDAVAGDSDLLLMASRAKIQSGDQEAGIALLEQGVSQFPQNTELQMGLASAYLGQGQLDRAISSLNALVAEGDEAFKRNALLVFAHVQNKEVDKALELLNQLLKQDPENAQTHVLMAAVYSLDKSSGAEKALQHFEKALSIESENISALMGMGRLALNEGDLASAQTRFERVHELSPTHLGAVLALAHIAQKNQQSESVLAWLVKAVEINPDAAKAKSILFRYLFKRQQYDELEAQSAKLVARNGKDTVAVNSLVFSLHKQEKFDEALSAVKQAIKLQPQEASFYYGMGRIYFEKKDVKQSQQAYKKALEINPMHQAAVIALVEQEERAGNMEGVLKLVDGYRKRAPKDIFSYLLLGNVMQRQGEHNKALKAFADAKALEPTNFVLLSKIYQVKRSLGDDTIVGDLNEWLQASPDDVRVNILLAEHYQRVGQNDKAITVYEKVAGLQADNFVALNNLAWLYYIKQDKRALETAKSAYQLKSDDASIEDTLGWIMVESGKVAEGVVLLQSAATRAPEVADIQYHLAYGLHKQGDEEKAKVILKGLVESNQKFSYADEAKRLYQSL